MSLLTEQEITGIANNDALWDDGKHLGEATLNEYRYARAIESTVIEKIKGQGAAAWLHCERQDADVVTDAVKHVWGKAVVGSLTLYDLPLYRLPEGD